MGDITLILRTPEHMREQMLPHFEKAASILHMTTKNGVAFTEGADQSLELKQTGTTPVPELGEIACNVARNMEEYQVRICGDDTVLMVHEGIQAVF